MSSCAVCHKPVVIDPDLLADGELCHAACKRQLANGRFNPKDSRDPPSGTRIRIARPNRRTG